MTLSGLVSFIKRIPQLCGAVGCWLFLCVSHSNTVLGRTRFIVIQSKAAVLVLSLSVMDGFDLVFRLLAG